MTVADLRRKGAMPLNNAQLNELLVGKSLWMRNTVTGGRYESVYQKDGLVLTAHVSKNAITETEVGKLPAAYSIQNGKVVSSIGNTAFDLTFYKMGGAYYAARSDEFGYANYQITATPPVSLAALRNGRAKEHEKGN